MPTAPAASKELADTESLYPEAAGAPSGGPSSLLLIIVILAALLMATVITGIGISFARVTDVPPAKDPGEKEGHCWSRGRAALASRLGVWGERLSEDPALPGLELRPRLCIPGPAHGYHTFRGPLAYSRPFSSALPSPFVYFSRLLFSISSGVLFP